MEEDGVEIDDAPVPKDSEANDADVAPEKQNEEMVEPAPVVESTEDPLPEMVNDDEDLPN